MGFSPFILQVFTYVLKFVAKTNFIFLHKLSFFTEKKQFSISILFFSTPSLQKDAFSTIKLVTNYDLKSYFVNHQLQLNETCVDACQTDFRLNFLLLMKRTSFQSNKTEHFPCIFWFYLVMHCIVYGVTKQEKIAGDLFKHCVAWPYINFTFI